MRTQGMAFSDLAFVLVPGIVIGLVILVGMAVGAGFPVASVLIIGGVYYASVLMALAVGEEPLGEAAKVRTEPVPAVAPAAGPELELLDMVPVPVAPFTIRVASVTGICALGFQQGDTWVIDRGGHLSPRLCRPAVAALSPLLELLPEEGQQVSCHCPLGNRQVAFAVQERR